MAKEIRIGDLSDGTISSPDATVSTDNVGDDLEVQVHNGDYVLVDTNGNAVLRWNASEAEWQFESQDITGVGSLSTESLNNTRHIDPGTADIGADVNDAIADLSPEGGQVILPPGFHNLDTQIDLSDGENNQDFDTPISVIGQGATNSRNAGAHGFGNTRTGIDATGLDEPAIFCGQGRSGLTIQGLSVDFDDDAEAVIQIGYAQGGSFSGSVAESRFVDLQTYGGNNGIRLGGPFGCYAAKLQANGHDGWGISIGRANACTFNQLTSRLGNSGVRVRASLAAVFNGIYNESLNSSAFQLEGQCASTQFNGIYSEATNQDGGGDYAIRVTSGSTNESVGFNGVYVLGGSGYAAGNYDGGINIENGDQFILSNAYVDIETGFDRDLFIEDGSGGGLIMASTFKRNVNSTTDAGGCTWIQNSIGGTDNRSGDDEIIGAGD